MSLEKNIDRIATALERIAAAAEARGNPVITVPAAAPVAPAPATQPPVATAPVTPVTPPPVAAVPPTAPVAPPAPPAASVSDVSAEQLNQFLIEQAGRLGGPDKIFEVLREKFGAASISNIVPTQFRDVINAVQALS